MEEMHSARYRERARGFQVLLKYNSITHMFTKAEAPNPMGILYGASGHRFNHWPFRLTQSPAPLPFLEGGRRGGLAGTECSIPTSNHMVGSLGNQTPSLG